MINKRKKVSCVYIIVCLPSKGFYIGASVDWVNRKSKHKRELNKGIHYNKRLQSSWNKYGQNSFAFLILEFCSADVVYERENFFIQQNIKNISCFNSEKHSKGYRVGYIMSEETKRRIGEANKKSLKGKKLTEQHKLNVKNALVARYKVIQMPSPSEETREKMRLAKLGKPAPHNAHPKTEETKKKISEAKKGHKWSEETRKKHEERHHKNRNKKLRKNNG